MYSNIFPENLKINDYMINKNNLLLFCDYKDIKI